MVRGFAVRARVMALSSTVADGDSTVEQALAGAPNAGWYRFRIADGRWEWSPEVEIIQATGLSPPNRQRGWRCRLGTVSSPCGRLMFRLAIAGVQIGTGSAPRPRDFTPAAREGLRSGQIIL